MIWNNVIFRLNSKKQRERYKHLIYQNKSDAASEKDVEETMNEKMIPTLDDGAVSIAGSDNVIPLFAFSNAVFEEENYNEFPENLEESICSLKNVYIKVIPTTYYWLFIKNYIWARYLPDD